MTDFPALSRKTLAVTAGRPPRRQGAPVNPPVVMSSTYVSQGAVEPGEFFYARNDTETWQSLELVLGQLERSDRPGVLFASGMAAIAATMSLIPPGGHLIVPRHSYQITLAHAVEVAERCGVSLAHVDIADTDRVLEALAATPTSMLWIESPTNPMLEVADIPALSRAAHRRGAIVVVDNTFATPMGQQPLTLGADVVVHSVTKYLSGHSDVVLGAAITDDADFATKLRTHRTRHGAIPGPWEAWLALRGVRTLPLRWERACENAAILAQRLSRHPGVVRTRHPSLPSDPGHELAKAQIRGFGAIVCIQVRGGRQAADDVVSRLRLWVPATSLGGVESTIERRRRFSTESSTVPEDLLRLSVGVEDVEDLWQDLSEALDSIR